MFNCQRKRQMTKSPNKIGKNAKRNSEKLVFANEPINQYVISGSFAEESDNSFTKEINDENTELDIKPANIKFAIWYPTANSEIK